MRQKEQKANQALSVLFLYINYNKYNNLINSLNEMLQGTQSWSLCRADILDFAVVVVPPVDSVFVYCVLCFFGIFHSVSLQFSCTFSPHLSCHLISRPCPPHLCSSTCTSSPRCFSLYLSLSVSLLCCSPVPVWSWIKLPPLPPADFYFNLQHHILWDRHSATVLKTVMSPK